MIELLDTERENEKEPAREHASSRREGSRACIDGALDSGTDEERH